MQTNLYRKQISSCLVPEDGRGVHTGGKPRKGYKHTSDYDKYVHYINCGNVFS